MVEGSISYPNSHPTLTLADTNIGLSLKERKT